MKRLVLVATDDVIARMMSNAEWIGQVQSFTVETIEEEAQKSHKPRNIATSAICRIIMTHYQVQGEFDQEASAKWMEKDHFSRNSAASACSALVEAGYLEKKG